MGACRLVGLEVWKAWRLGGLLAWRLVGLEAWRLVGLEAWRLGGLEAWRRLGGGLEACWLVGSFA